MAKRENFTADRVAGFKCLPGKQQTIYWDAKTPGLGLRVTTAGAKSYIFETKLNKKTLRLTIGDVRTWAVGDAQKKATSLKALTDEKIDPRQLRAEELAVAAAKLAEEESKSKERSRGEVPLSEAWQDYLEDRQPHWSPRHYNNHVALAKPGGTKRARGRRQGDEGNTLPGPIFPILSTRLTNLDSETVKAWLRKEVVRGPTQAESAYRKLRTFATWCASVKKYAGIVPSDAFTHREVRAEVPKMKPKDDCLQREQLSPWFKAVREINNPFISAYLQILLLTGSRRNELAPLKWVDVEFTWKKLTIRDKVEGERTIPLTPYVAFLLMDLRRRNETPPNIRRMNKSLEDNAPWKPSPYVFTSKTAASGYIAEPRIAHNQALRVAGIDGLTIHGLRRSFGTLCEWVDTPTGISAQIMGHKPSALAEKHYRRRPIDMLRTWHEMIEAWILEQAGIEFKLDQEKPTLKAAQ